MYFQIQALMDGANGAKRRTKYANIDAYLTALKSDYKSGLLTADSYVCHVANKLPY